MLRHRTSELQRVVLFAARGATQVVHARHGLEIPKSPGVTRTTQEAERAVAEGDQDQEKWVGPVGLEPTTRGLKVRCSAN